MSTPAARFHTDQPTDQALPLRLPTQLGPGTPTPPLGPLELELIVPACGNLGLAGRQLWLGRRHAGTRVRLWIDHQVIHLSADGQLLKTVASRFTPAELPRLRQLGARPAGPPPATTPAGALGIPEAVECDRLVNAAGLIGLGGRQLIDRHAVGSVAATQLRRVGGDGVLGARAGVAVGPRAAAARHARYGRSRPTARRSRRGPAGAAGRAGAPHDAASSSPATTTGLFLSAGP